MNRLSLLLKGAATAALLTQGALAADYTQAPALDAAVKEGKLPPVAERLPDTPFAITAPEVGKYGGTWNSALKGASDEVWIRRTAVFEPMLTYDLNWTGVFPNIAESWSSNEDATVWTLKLRKGHKWSDGTPFTSEDVVFAINDVLTDPSYPGEPVPWITGAKAEAPDAQTVVITLPKPNALFHEYLAGAESPQLAHFPKAFCGQFHPKYNPDADKLAQEAKLPNWQQLMVQKCDIIAGGAPERPSIAAWLPKVANNGLTASVDWERNPYYYKVDQNGQQLPYLDALHMARVEDTNSIVMLGVAGKLDFTARHIDTAANKPVFYDNQEKGNYRLYSTLPADMNTAVISFNMNTDDKALADLFQKKDFRVAMSLATDREEIIEVVFAGQGKPWQAAPRPESKFYDEELATQFTEYDPDKANEMLDALGLDKRNSAGIRLLPDGRPLELRLDLASNVGQQFDVMELIVGQWAEVGVKLDLRKAEPGFVNEQRNANKHMIDVWKGDGGLGDAILDARYYVPSHRRSAYAMKWAMNYYAPDNPMREDAPEAVQKQMATYQEIFRTPDEAKRDELFREVLNTAKDQFYTIGISLPASGYGVATNVMHNVPENQPNAWVYLTPGPMNTPLLWKDQ